ncbi:DUF1707 SHOCT-like domain-containing protein [Corynebacterium ulceribovis]|uniref:DUF1707 SHOCT-like domain-containing protein n=1 Tax=Corynebacterium ulceribovis TaxID=487732 RepID=UPI000368D43F|nr:DUF1707 domain-containing protein [Corynebacterium ulceribovis]
MNANLRASDDDRQRVADLLAHAVSRGQITLPEMEDRITEAWAAVKVADLYPLIDDLVPHPEQALSAPYAGSGPYTAGLPVPAPNYAVAETSDARSMPPLDVAKQYVVEGADAFPVSVCLMFGLERNGSWTVAPQHTNFTILGGTELDLTRARLSAQHTTITAIAIMGGIQVVVPEDIRLTVSGFGIMGGFGSTSHKDVTIYNDHLPADAPSVTVNGVAIMGGVEVKRVPRYRNRAELEG